jgi:hypothetical protein
MLRKRTRDFEVFSLSAIDLFASAMGAFVIITLILMPDYRKEVIAQGDQTLLERLRADSEDALEDAADRRSEAQSRLAFAQRELEELMAQANALGNELAEARELWIAKNDPPPTPEPARDLAPDDRVSFRFLGLKTDRRRFLFLVDMNRYLGQHGDAQRQAVIRAMSSLKDGHEFAILGFQQLDAGPRLRRWPADGGLAYATTGNQAEARAFLDSLEGLYGGSAPTLLALREGLSGPADALVLFSDGLPNPRYNEGLDYRQLVRRITRENGGAKEIHTVVIGDYFSYQDTIAFMESLAQDNGGGFLALLSQ